MGRSIPMMVNTWSKSKNVNTTKNSSQTAGPLTVLHNITDDAKIIEVTATSFRSKGLLERYLSRGA